ncbi:unnamed protein product [Linum tenue]|uniref:Radical SAM core domain-containing protein n=1 Tax=Linum tenue TaxID=586396 RepID=A0AAV0HMC6_9ROSI|nr:unnamed protein product [Linum tenue]
MEMGCVWIRRMRFAGPNSNLVFKQPPLLSSSSATATLALHNPQITLPPGQPHNLTLNFTPSRRFFSNTAFSSPHSSVSVSPKSSAGDAGPGDAGAKFRGDGSKVLLKEMRYSELEKWVQSHGFRPGQAMMLWKRLYGLNNIWAHCVDELEGLNKDFKKLISEQAQLNALTLQNVVTASDGTRKVLFRLNDGLVIETVVIPCDRGKPFLHIPFEIQVHLSSLCFLIALLHFLDQYCRMGLTRHLTTAEIVEQAVFARRLLTSEVGSITNVVFMGMGEPLQNIENVIKAADIMVDEQGLQFSPRKVTVSTSGLVPQLKRFLHESNCSLAVSLNATTDEVRNWIMPINRKYNISLLLDTLRQELQCKHKYKVLFEYVMLAGVNDSVEDAGRLIDLVKGIPCTINLIQFNPHCGSQFRPTSIDKMIEFRNLLAQGKCSVFLRQSRGDDQMAACGQLGKPGTFQAPVLRVPEKFQMAVANG